MDIVKNLDSFSSFQPNSHCFQLEEVHVTPKVLKAMWRMFVILHFEKTQEYLARPELLDRDFHLMIMLREP